MHAVKTRTMDSTSSPELVFAALLGAVQHGKFKLVGLNNEHRMARFTSGKTAISWGQEFIANVRSDDGRTQLELTCGGLDDRPKALLDGWKSGKAADKVIAAVQAVLADPASAPVESVASFIIASDGSTRPWTGPDVPVD